MEIKTKYLVIWLVLLIIGVAMIVGPVVARNETGFRPKIYDKGIKIDKSDKDIKNKDSTPSIMTTTGYVTVKNAKQKSLDDTYLITTMAVLTKQLPFIEK